MKTMNWDVSLMFCSSLLQFWKKKGHESINNAIITTKKLTKQCQPQNKAYQFKGTWYSKIFNKAFNNNTACWKILEYQQLYNI